jgi:uncharacterized protein YciI
MYVEGRRSRSVGALHCWRLGSLLHRLQPSVLPTVCFVPRLLTRLLFVLFSAMIETGMPMGYYALFYREVVPDFVAQRAVYREEHLGLAREAHSRGELVLAGALAEPPDGALLIFRGGDDTAAQEFVRKDPYVRNGLVKRWEIRPWTVVVGNQ